MDKTRVAMECQQAYLITGAEEREQAMIRAAEELLLEVVSIELTVVVHEVPWAVAIGVASVSLVDP